MGDFTHHIAEAGTATMQTKAAYTAAVVTGTSSVLTFNEIIGAVGVVASILLAAFTAWSNHRKNKLQMQLMRSQLDQANGQHEVDKS